MRQLAHRVMGQLADDFERFGSTSSSSYSRFDRVY
jgi:hypothetical protein